MYRMYGMPKTLAPLAGQALPRAHGCAGAVRLTGFCAVAQKYDTTQHLCFFMGH
jgi:hypothetical protein